MKTYSENEYKIRHRAKNFYLISLKGKKDVALFKINKEQWITKKTT